MRRRCLGMWAACILMGFAAGAARADEIARWTFNDITPEGVAPDSSGHKNSEKHAGNLVGGAVVETVIGYNRAVLLDGVKAYIDFGNHGDFDFTGPFSMELWLLVHPKAKGGETLLAGKSAAVYGLSFYYTDNNTYFYINGGGIETRVRHTLAYDQWHHMVCTYDPEAGLRLYIDGELVETNAGKIQAPSSLLPLRVGSPFADADPEQPSAAYLCGLIDEFRLYDHALSAEQVAASKTAGPTRK